MRTFGFKVRNRHARLAKAAWHFDKLYAKCGASIGPILLLALVRVLLEFPLIVQQHFAALLELPLFQLFGRPSIVHIHNIDVIACNGTVHLRHLMSDETTLRTLFRQVLQCD